MIVKYAMSSIERSFPEETTVGDILSDPNILGAIGAPEGVVAVSNGETLDASAYVESYASITLEKRASSKA